MGLTEEKFQNNKILSKVLAKFTPNGNIIIKNLMLEQDLAA